MIWAAGGILLWIGGWWFTGRLVDVYQKAIYLAEANRRHRGLGPSGDQHHRGMLLFVLFDLGLLMLGIRSLAIMKAGSYEALADSSIATSATEWSVLACLYLFRQGSNIHGFYHARWRARTGISQVKPTNAGTLRGVWQETSPALRVPLLMAPLIACVPLATGSSASLLLWFLLPQSLLAIALVLPLLRLRRRVHQGET